MLLFYYLPATLFFIGIANPLHIPPWNSFHSEFFCAAAVIILLLTKAIKQKISINQNFLLATSFIYIFIFSAIVISEKNADYINLVVYITIYIASYVCGLNSKELKNIIILNFFIFISLFLALSIFVQFLNIDEYSTLFPSTQNTKRPGGSLLQANHTATFLCIGLICCLQTNISKTLLTILFFIVSIALAITESRTGTLSFIIGATYLIATKKISKKTFVLSNVTLIISYLLTHKFYDLYYLNTIDSTLRANFQSGRFATWPILIEAILKNPLTGYGFNDVFNALDQKIRGTSYTQTEPFHYSHNVLLDLFIWLGTPIATLITIISSKKILNVLSEKSETATIIIPIIVHALLEYPHAYVYFGAPLFFIFGRNLRFSNNTILINKQISIAISLFITSALLIYSKLYINSEELIRAIRFNNIGIKEYPIFLQEQKILPYFQIDQTIQKIKIKQGITEEEIKKLEFAAKNRPSKIHQKKYTESLYLSNNCVQYHAQIEVIRVYYGKEYSNKIKNDIESNYKNINDCRL